MPIDSAALAAELATDPQSLGYAAALAGPQPHESALRLIQAPTRPGYVPARHLAVVLAAHSYAGHTLSITGRGQFPDGTPAPAAVQALFGAVHLATYSTLDPPIRLLVGSLTTDLTVAVGAGIITTGIKDEILAGLVPIGRDQELFGLDSRASLADIAAAVRLNGGG